MLCNDVTYYKDKHSIYIYMIEMEYKRVNYKIKPSNSNAI